MDFVSNKLPQIQEMLKTIGVSNLDELLSSIPAKLRLPRPSLDDGMSEYEGLGLMESLASSNTYPQFENYLGAGAYEHHIPAIASAICAKSEFLTSYTPYQAEASQGMLQAIFEYQSAICALTGMDVSNASLYDGASACAESILMSLRLQKNKSKIVISGALHPLYLAVIKQYLMSHQVSMEFAPIAEDGSGRLDLPKLLEKTDASTAAVLIQSPNFFGAVEDLKAAIPHIKKCGALCVLCANPLSYGIFASAGELGADIAVGDCQPFGLPMQYGGPFAGYLACRKEFMRQMPGRIVGETKDSLGRRGFVLTLQAREQHIRREKATSNICTNQALAALASLVTMLWYGKEGLQKAALANYRRTAYLKAALEKIPGVATLARDAFFNEFAVAFNRPASDVLKHFRTHGIEPGLDLGKYYPQYHDYLLVAVTETKNKAQLDRYVQVAAMQR